MCEMFGVSSLEPVEVCGLLQEFFSHSSQNPNGWGLALFHGNAVSLEKEPVAASRSTLLQQQLRRPLETSSMIAHIRRATRGSMDYGNCHPFVMEDSRGRTWTLAHNGTVFESPELDSYARTQQGQTDSERILCRIIDLVNREQGEKGRDLTAEERFQLLDGLVCRNARRNKLNLMIYDGDLLYVHMNYADSLYLRQTGDTALFATVPLGREHWEPVPFTTLLAYRNGREVFRGTDHGQEYLDGQWSTNTFFLHCAGL